MVILLVPNRAVINFWVSCSLVRYTCNKTEGVHEKKAKVTLDFMSISPFLCLEAKSNLRGESRSPISNVTCGSFAIHPFNCYFRGELSTKGNFIVASRENQAYTAGLWPLMTAVLPNQTLKMLLFSGDWKIAGSRKEETDSVRVAALWRDRAWNK